MEEKFKKNKIKILKEKIINKYIIRGDDNNFLKN